MKKSQLIFICNALALGAAILGIIQLVNLGDTAYELGRATTEQTSNYIYRIIAIKGMQALTIFITCIVFSVTAFQAKKGAIFTKENENLLSLFGIIISIIGIFTLALVRIYKNDMLPESSGIIMTLLGFSFVFFAVVLKIGRKIKEEQDLTI